MKNSRLSCLGRNLSNFKPCITVFAYKTALIAVLGIGLFSTFGINTSHAAEWDSELSIEVRSFLNDSQRANQKNENLSLSFETEFYHDWDDDNQRFVIKPFARVDSLDDERTHFDLREFYWRKTFENQNLDLKIGLSKVFWGVTESVHLVDIINQNDGVENLDGEDKLGQPMINLSLDKDWGIVDFFILPYFRERTFPSLDGRPSLPFRIDIDNPVYISGAEEEHVDLALRYAQVFGDWDVGISHFSGTSREPLLVPSITATGLSLTPFYDQIEQSSLDLQATLENWLWKLELISNQGTLQDRYTALAGGFEYSFYDLKESGIDLGFIAEYLFDDRKEQSTSTFQNDIFIGGRFAFNDENNADLLAGIVYDLDNQTQFFSLEASMRIGQSMKVNLESRFFSVDDSSDAFFAIKDDDYIGINLTRFF